MAEPSLTINEFCALEKISRATFYIMQKRGVAPKTYRHGAGHRRISPEALADWRREREREAAAAAAAVQ